MAMIKKEVTGISEDLKLVKNAKAAPTSPKGGTQRSSFEGSRDPRKSGGVNANRVLKGADGYVNQADVMMGDVSHSRSFTTPGARGGASGAVTTAKEDVTRGMGGRVIKDMS
jgi:hypothetical protein